MLRGVATVAATVRDQAGLVPWRGGELERRLRLRAPPCGPTGSGRPPRYRPSPCCSTWTHVARGSTRSRTRSTRSRTSAIVVARRRAGRRTKTGALPTSAFKTPKFRACQGEQVTKQVLIHVLREEDQEAIQQALAMVCVSHDSEDALTRVKSGMAFTVLQLRSGRLHHRPGRHPGRWHS
jgi:hypothetical protein